MKNQKKLGINSRIERCIEDQFILAGSIGPTNKNPNVVVNIQFLQSLLNNFYNQEVLKKPREKFLKQFDKKLKNYNNFI